MDLRDRLLGEADRRDRDRRRPAFEQALGRVADRDVSVRGVRVRAERDHVGPLALGKRTQPLGSRAVGDDVARDLGAAEDGGAALEQLVGLALHERLAVAVGLVRVTDVGKRHLGACAREHATERDGVVLVCGAVVRNDDLGGHDSSPVVRVALQLAKGRWVRVSDQVRTHGGSFLPSGLVKSLNPAISWPYA